MKTIKITRGELRRVLREGLFGNLFKRTSAAETPSTPATDAEKLQVALQLPDPESDREFMDVFARRMNDIHILNDEYAAHLKSLGQTGDLVGALRERGMSQLAQALMGRIRVPTTSSSERERMMRGLVREELRKII